MLQQKIDAALTFEQLNSIGLSLEKIRRHSLCLAHHDSNKSRTYSIYLLGCDIYKALYAEYHYCANNLPHNSNRSKENAQLIAITSALFLAKTAKEQEEVLAVFSQVAHDSYKYGNKEYLLAAALCALGLLLVGAALSFLIFSGFGPTILLTYYPLADFTAQCLAAYAWFMVSAIGCGGSVMGAVGCFGMAPELRKEEQRHVTKMHTLYSLFFQYQGTRKFQPLLQSTCDDVLHVVECTEESSQTGVLPIR